jgi:hypothetical protein
MLRPASRLARATRWLPLVVVGLAGPSIAGWGSAVTVLAQADGEDQQSPDIPAPVADDSSPVVEDMPADAAIPAPEATLPAADDTPAPEATLPAADDTPAAPPPQAGDAHLCVTVTSDPNGTVTVATQPCPPDSP